MARVRHEIRVMNVQSALVQRIIAIVLIVAGIVGWLVLRDQTQDLTASEDAGKAATRVARASLPNILSYTDSELVQQISKNRDLMTSGYAKKYEGMVRSRVLPQATEFGVANQLTVVSVAVVRAEPAHAVLLAYANQTTRTKAQPKGVTQGTRLEVTMQKRGTTWLVDDLKPL